MCIRTKDSDTNHAPSLTVPLKVVLKSSGELWGLRGHKPQIFFFFFFFTNLLVWLCNKLSWLQTSVCLAPLCAGHRNLHSLTIKEEQCHGGVGGTLLAPLVTETLVRLWSHQGDCEVCFTQRTLKQVTDLPSAAPTLHPHHCEELPSSS